MKEFVGLRTKPYNYLIDNKEDYKKEKAQKKFFMKRKFKFEGYKHCLEATQLENKINHLK